MTLTFTSYLAITRAFLKFSMAEEERGFLSTLQRQIFRTHRPFRSTIMDTEGNVILKVHRPFAFINSRTFVQRHVLNSGESDTGWLPFIDFCS